MVQNTNSVFEVANSVLDRIQDDHLQTPGPMHDVTHEEYPIQTSKDAYVFPATHPNNATMPSSDFLGDGPDRTGNHYVMANLKTSDDPFTTLCALVDTAVRRYMSDPHTRLIVTEHRETPTRAILSDAAVFMTKQYYIPYLHEIDARPDTARFADTYTNGVTFEKDLNADWIEGNEVVQMKTSYTSLPDKVYNFDGKVIRRQIDSKTGEAIKAPDE